MAKSSAKMETKILTILLLLVARDKFEGRKLEIHIVLLTYTHSLIRPKECESDHSNNVAKSSGKVLLNMILTFPLINVGTFINTSL